MRWPWCAGCIYPLQNLLQSSIEQNNYTVNANPDSLLNCLAEAIKPIIDIVEPLVPEWEIPLKLADLAARLTQCGQDLHCASKQIGIWTASLLLSRFTRAGALLAHFPDLVSNAFSGGEGPACLYLVDLFDAYSHEL